MKEIIARLFLLLLMVTPNVYAVKIKNLYQADIPVTTQAESERSQAIKEGMRQVLIKVTGDAHIEEKPVIKEILHKADYYVQEYGYFSADPVMASQYNIQVRFAPEDIHRVLKKAGLTMWNPNRPLILVWLSIRKNGHSEIVGGDTNNRLTAMMKTQGQQYGLPIIFPMMDITDLNKITIDDLTDISMEMVQEASKRYAPDAYLIGTIDQTNASCDAHWQLILGANKWDFTMTNVTPENAMSEALNEVGYALAKHEAVKAANKEQSIQHLVQKSPEPVLNKL